MLEVIGFACKYNECISPAFQKLVKLTAHLYAEMKRNTYFVAHLCICDATCIVVLVCMHVCMYTLHVLLHLRGHCCHTLAN